jgi:ketosteroid isomerase-like protein
MPTVESMRRLLATFEAYEDTDFERGEVVFDRILGVGDRELIAGHRGAERFTSVFTLAEGRVVRVQDYASIDSALEALKRPGT